MHTIEYYSALNRKEILTYVTTWMKLEDIMQSEISQSQKGKYHICYLHEVPRLVKIVETRK